MCEERKRERERENEKASFIQRSGTGPLKRGERERRDKGDTKGERDPGRRGVYATIHNDETRCGSAARHGATNVAWASFADPHILSMTGRLMPGRPVGRSHPRVGSVIGPYP